MLKELGADCTGRQRNTIRISWIKNNVIPDSIITNMICRSLLPPPVELEEPKVRPFEFALRSKNVFRILNTIKPVTRAFTTMDAAKLVRTTGVPQSAAVNWPWSNVIAASDPNQVARGENLKSAYQTEIFD